MLALITQAMAVSHPSPAKIQRLPLQKKSIILRAPTNYEKRILRYHPQTNEPVYYDPKPQVIPLNERTGTYAFKWIGYDGQEKTIVYQRPDAINAIISASVSKTDTGQYLYVYNIKNLQSSGEYLSDFFVQHFASHVKPVRVNDVFIGSVSRNGKEFKDGNWVGFGILTPIVIPGRDIQLKLVSPSPPSLVECRIAGGQRGMKGVGEDMPQELENVLPGYEAWPSGYTIGPVDNMNSLSSTERAKYILNLLPQFQRLGWMTDSTLHWYQENLRRKNLGAIAKHADRDLKAGNITDEVFSIIRQVR